LLPPSSRPTVRKTPSWPRSWANFSFLFLHSDRNAWANWDILGQPNSFLTHLRGGLARGRGDQSRPLQPPALVLVGARLAPELPVSRAGGQRRLSLVHCAECVVLATTKNEQTHLEIHGNSRPLWSSLSCGSWKAPPPRRAGAGGAGFSSGQEPLLWRGSAGGRGASGAGSGVGSGACLAGFGRNERARRTRKLRAVVWSAGLIHCTGSLGGPAGRCGRAIAGLLVARGSAAGCSLVLAAAVSVCVRTRL
jgi:hypothetical protein